MEPINYMGVLPQIDLGRIGANAMQMIAQGAEIGAANDKQRQAQQLQQQYQADVGAALKNPTGQAFAALSARYPGQHEALKQSWSQLSEAQQKDEFGAASHAYAAIQSGRPDLAQQIFEQRIAAKNNAGVDTSEDQMVHDLIKSDPKQAAGFLGYSMFSADPDKYAENVSKFGGEQRARDKAPADLEEAKAKAKTAQVTAQYAEPQANADLQGKLWNVKNVQSEIGDRSRRLALDQDKLTTETQLKLTELQQKFGELPEYVAKDINSSTTDSIAAAQSAQRMNSLAGQISAASKGLGGGVYAKTGELWKSTFGSQNELTRLRSEYNRMVTPAAMAAYKQVASGSTSDRDIDTALTGVPKDSADPETMASFLRGMAKLQTYDSVLNNAKSEWLGQVRSLGKTSKDLEIDGAKVPAGTTFKAFSDQYVGKKVGKMLADQVVTDLSNKYPPRLEIPQGGIGR